MEQDVRQSTKNMYGMTDRITVGGESNVMFGINNTGKVILYNVTVSFAGDSIRPVDSYVGNIKPGETGNVDAMLMGTAPTMDEGIIPITISYEDENGNACEPVSREMTLFVTEEMPQEWDVPVDGEAVMEEEPSFWDKYKLALLGGGGLCLAAAAVFGVRLRKKRKAAREEEEIEDEDI
mgnify:FL=1